MRRKLSTRLAAATCSAMLASAGLVACSEEGPAERAGKKIDQAAEDVKDAFRPDEGPLERLGREVDEAGEAARNAAREAKEAAREAEEQVDG